jgi:hypothetical protein
VPGLASACLVGVLPLAALSLMPPTLEAMGDDGSMPSPAEVR